MRLSRLKHEPWGSLVWLTLHRNLICREFWRKANMWRVNIRVWRNWILRINKSQTCRYTTITLPIGSKWKIVCPTLSPADGHKTCLRKFGLTFFCVLNQTEPRTRSKTDWFYIIPSFVVFSTRRKSVACLQFIRIDVGRSAKFTGERGGSESHF